MICSLPNWATTVSMLLMIVVAGGSALGVIEWCSRVGKRRHPGITFGDQHSRTIWNSLGVFLGIFVTFPLVAVLFLGVIRPALCEVVGTWHKRPDYSVDFNQLHRETEQLRREIEAMRR